MGVLRVEKEVPSAVAPSRLFKALNDSHNLLPKIAPQTIKSIDILQGDGGVGTVKLLKFAGGGDYHQTKQRIDALDKANLTGKYTTYEGDGILKLAEKSVYDIKIVDSGNGGTGPSISNSVTCSNKDSMIYQQSVGSTGNGVPLSGLTGLAPQFESQGSRLCWENLCLPVRAGTSSLSCGTGLKVPPTVGALPKIPRD